jgi:hypothetical protein
MLLLEHAMIVMYLVTLVLIVLTQTVLLALEDTCKTEAYE